MVWKFVITLLFVVLPAMAQPPSPVDTAAANVRIKLFDVKDTDIRDAIRMLSKGYNLNILVDKDVTGKVTVHLSDVPIMEGLRSLSESNGLEVVTEGNMYRIRKKVEEQKTFVRFQNGKLTVDVQNVDVREFLQDVSTKAAVSVVPDNKVSGKITGKLFQVDFDDGLRAILEGNGYTVTRRRNIYQVTASDQAESPGQPPMGRQFRPRQTAGRSDFFVDYKNGKLTIDVANGNLEDVIKAIAEQTDVQIVTYGSIRADVNAKLFDKSLTDAFALLLGGTNYTFVEKDSIILIGDRNAATPSGQALSKSELIHLNHIKADGVPQILPKNLSDNNIKVIKEQNALLVSGTSEDIVKVQEFLKSVDLPTPQVRIDAVIVEYSDNVSKEFGMRAWAKRKDQRDVMSLSLPTLGGDASGVQWEGSNRMLRDLFADTFVGGIFNALPKDFFAAIRMLEKQDKARVLAQPSILTLNGNKASITVDQTQYFKIALPITSTVANTTPEQYFRFQPIKFGIQLNITPWISQGGQITVEIAPEVSNGEKSTNEYPNVSSRTLSTTVRINNGQTLALGGLIKNADSRSYDKIPILGDLPLIGPLFRYNSRGRNRTNLVIYITPHIISDDENISLGKELRNSELNMMGPWERKAYEKYEEMRRRRDSTDSMDDTVHSGSSSVNTKDTSHSAAAPKATPNAAAPAGTPVVQPTASDSASAVTKKPEMKRRRLFSRSKTEEQTQTAAPPSQ